jgi:hypothetical protein
VSFAGCTAEVRAPSREHRVAAVQGRHRHRASPTNTKTMGTTAAVLGWATPARTRPALFPQAEPTPSLQQQVCSMHDCTAQPVQAAGRHEAEQVGYCTPRRKGLTQEHCHPSAHPPRVAKMSPQRPTTLVWGLHGSCQAQLVQHMPPAALHMHSRTIQACRHLPRTPLWTSPAPSTGRHNIHVQRDTAVGC